MVSALDSRSNGQGSSSVWGHCGVFLRHFTLIVLLATQVYKNVPVK